MDLIFSNIFPITPIDGSYYRVINSSILQKMFYVSQNFCHAMKKKQLRKAKRKNEYCSMVVLFENIALWYLLLYDFHF